MANIMKKINVIVPVYEEEEIIALFNETLFLSLEKLTIRFTFEVIYVVDRGSDRTLEILEDIHASNPHVTILSLSRRFGYQNSIIAGIDHCDGDAAIIMDADLEHPPTLISALLEKFDKGYDVVHTVKNYHQDINFMKRFSSRLFYRLLNLISDMKMLENSEDFRLVSKRVLQVFQSSIREQNQFLRGLFQWVGFRSTQIYFTTDKRAAGQSKFNFRSMFTFAVFGFLSFSKVPLKAAAALGSGMAISSFLYAALLVFKYLFYNTAPPGWATIVILILFVGGTQLLVLGILGSYIGSIFDEVKKRPLYLVEKMVRRGNHSLARSH